jgi:hypothetical protein
MKVTGVNIFDVEITKLCEIWRLIHLRAQPYEDQENAGKASCEKERARWPIPNKNLAMLPILCSLARAITFLSSRSPSFPELYGHTSVGGTGAATSYG